MSAAECACGCGLVARRRYIRGHNHPRRNYEPPEDRFWRLTFKTDGCWHYIGNRAPFGYGLIWVHNKLTTTHRYSWRLHFGEIPAGMQVLHKCDEPSCVNPAHLFLGTQRDNMHDMIAKGRGVLGVAQ